MLYYKEALKGMFDREKVNEQLQIVKKKMQSDDFDFSILSNSSSGDVSMKSNTTCFLLDKLSNTELKTVCDLSCGDGQVIMDLLNEHGGVTNVVICDKSIVNIEMATSRICKKYPNVNIEYVVYEDKKEEEILRDTLKGRQFDSVVTNPPYLGKRALHQKFFNLAVELTKDGGDVVFIQPATMYFNKKENQKSAVIEMIDNLKAYKVNVKIVSSEIFENASVANDLSITHLIKVPSENNLIEKIEYKNGDVYYDVDIKNISQTRMPPDIYAIISKKIKDYIEKNGSLQDVIVTEEDKIKAKIAKIRGVSGPDSPMWYSLMPSDKKYWGTDSDYGIAVKNKHEVGNAYEYFKTYIARFGLAMSKFTANHHMGELRTVPLVDFSKVYTDADLCRMMDISDDEFLEIKKVIKPYYE